MPFLLYENTFTLLLQILASHSLDFTQFGQHTESDELNLSLHENFPQKIIDESLNLESVDDDLLFLPIQVKEKKRNSQVYSFM